MGSDVVLTGDAAREVRAGMKTSGQDENSFIQTVLKAALALTSEKDLEGYQATEEEKAILRLEIHRVRGVLRERGITVNDYSMRREA